MLALAVDLLKSIQQISWIKLSEQYKVTPKI